MSTTRSSRKCADTCATVSTPLRSRSGSGRTRCGSLRRRGRRRGRRSPGQSMETGARRLQAYAGESDWPRSESWRTEGRRVCRHGDPSPTLSPEGPKGAARAHRQFVRWLGGDMGAQTPGTARWAAAFRDIGRLERNPARPNYLAEVCPCEGIDSRWGARPRSAWSRGGPCKSESVVVTFPRAQCRMAA